MQYTVASGASLQAALDMAQSGDEVVLEAGATFQGTLNLQAQRHPRCAGHRTRAESAP